MSQNVGIVLCCVVVMTTGGNVWSTRFVYL